VQRPERGTGHQRLLGIAGAPAGIVEAEVDERVHARVAGLDPGDERVDHLDRRQIVPADAERQFGRRQARELVRERHRSLLVRIIQDGRPALVRRRPWKPRDRLDLLDALAKPKPGRRDLRRRPRTCRRPISRQLAARVLND
jgi:hypothetical protein